MDDEVQGPPPSIPNLSANFRGNRGDSNTEKPPSSVKRNIISNKNNLQDGDDEFDF